MLNGERGCRRAASTSSCRTASQLLACTPAVTARPQAALRCGARISAPIQLRGILQLQEARGRSAPGGPGGEPPPSRLLGAVAVSCTSKDPVEPAGSSSVGPTGDATPPSQGLSEPPAAAAIDEGPLLLSCGKQQGRLGSDHGSEAAGRGN